MSDSHIQTVLGPIAPSDLGFTLPHEHLFTDLRGPETPGYATSAPEEVALVMLPYLEAAAAAGANALVECSTVGVGRNVTILQHLAELTPIHIIAPTGVYREGFIPNELMDLSLEALADLWIKDLTMGIDGTEVKAGFIKIAASDEGLTPLEIRSLKAAATAARETGAVVASHTTSGAVAHHELDILEAAGLPLQRFIWVHAHTEMDQTIHLEVAKRGAILEFDAIGAPYADQEAMITAVLALVEAGFEEQVLLSHDAGWYQPGSPGGQPEDGIRGFTSLVEDFLPALKKRGMTDEIIETLTTTNPARIFTVN